MKPEELLPPAVKKLTDAAVTKVTSLLNRRNNAKAAHDKLCALEVASDPSVPLPVDCPKPMHQMQPAKLHMPAGMTLGAVAPRAPRAAAAAAQGEGEQQEEAAPEHMYGDDPLEKMNQMVHQHIRAAQVTYLQQLIAIKRSIVVDDSKAIEDLTVEVEDKVRACLADTCIPSADQRQILRAAGQVYADGRRDVVNKLETARKEAERERARKAQELEEEKLQQLQSDNSSTVGALIDYKLAEWESRESGVDPSDPATLDKNAAAQQDIAASLLGSKNGKAPPNSQKSRGQTKQKSTSKSTGQAQGKGKGKKGHKGKGKGKGRGTGAAKRGGRRGGN
eukprot:SAG11_NODE_1933_length_4040_cov_12.707435_1_plen_335_part_00